MSNQTRPGRGTFDPLPIAAAVLGENRDWIESNPGRTIAELQARIDLAVRQCAHLVAEGDRPVTARAGVPEPLASEVRQFPKADTDGTPLMLSDVGVILAGFAWRLSVLAAACGNGFRVGRLLEDERR